MTEKNEFVQQLKMTPAVPLDGTPFMGVVSFDGSVVPYEYTGWRDEIGSWIESAYLGTSISESFVYSLKGPDVVDFCKAYFVNDFDKFPVGRGKHGIMCNEKGNIMMDGVIMRTAEDEFVTIWIWPYVEYALAHSKGKYNVTGTNLTGQMFLYQIAGPTSLDILEKATGENLRDIEFVHFKMAKIAGHDVRIFRLGMAGTLSYEVHGDMQNAHDVYKAIWEAGKDEYGLKKIGYQTYMMNHTENGYAQYLLSFNYDWAEDQEYINWIMQNYPWMAGKVQQPTVKGSMNDPKGLLRNPYEIGLGMMVNFNHDFVGKEALAKIKNSNHRVMVTLEWNGDDIGDVFASQFRDDIPYQNMDKPNDYFMFDSFAPEFVYSQDQVLVNGKLVGLSTGRQRVEHYHRMISICSIDPEYAEVGQEVTILWGEPGTRQKEIRGKVTKFPYLKETLNRDIDVSKISSKVK